MERKKSIKDLGTLTGPLLVFGGVYSNWQALEKLQSLIEAYAIPAHHVICTGDVVAYCAQPEACVQAIRRQGFPTIAGNVEIQLREGQNDCGCDFSEGGRCDVFSRQWYPFAQQQLSSSSLEWMQGLPDFIRFQYAGKNFLVVHGSYHHTSEYIFASTPWAIKERNFIEAEAEVILSGHSGLPFSQQVGPFSWLNPGVIGMPANDGSPRVWYMLLNTLPDGHWTFEHQSFEYEHTQAAQQMRQQGLPPTYAQTLETGIWDNCEILPPAETALQGKVLFS